MWKEQVQGPASFLPTPLVIIGFSKVPHRSSRLVLHRARVPFEKKGVPPGWDDKA